MSIIDSITIVDNSNIDVITVATQGPSGPNQILSKSVNNIKTTQRGRKKFYI